MINHVTRNDTERKGFISSYDYEVTLDHWGSGGRSGGRNRSRGHGRTLLIVLLCCGVHSLLSYSIQNHPPRDSTAHSVLGPPPQLQACLQANLTGHSFSVKAPASEMSLACVKLTNRKQHCHCLLAVILSALKIREDGCGSAGL